ncbi:hypothetical protein GCM10022232_64980 [Streptomyces plumbiresistens]|uniref:Metallo-beta-lactamase domain-containing protein n=1 Tax=Streptomyces plumbiresistens TaxID=511811 RepID=A0ABP7SM03_9ACTN
MSARIEHLVTSGQFFLDGGTWDVENNVWIVGDDSEVIVIDAAHDTDAIARAVGERTLRAVVCTHAHNDHINAAPNSPPAPAHRSSCIWTTGCSGSRPTPTGHPTAISATADA